MKKAPAITLVVVFVLAIIAVAVLSHITAGAAHQHGAAAAAHILPTSEPPGIRDRTA